MKAIALRLLKLIAVLGLGMLAMRLFGPKLGERMEHMFEEAPEDFPPKWMYVNISAIRENTDRILEALGQRATEVEGQVA